MDLFPAIDIRDGRSVRLLQGDFARETVYGDPVERARELVSDGARWLHVVDLDAAATGVRSNRSAVEEIARVASAAGARIQVGGGVRNEDTVHLLLEAGVSRVVLGTAALAEPEMAIRAAAGNPGRVIVGLDYRRTTGRTGTGATVGGVAHMRLAAGGWVTATETSMEDALAWFEGSAVAAVVVTDIGRDGMLAGPDVDGLESIVASTAIDVIASGGVGTLEDLRRVREVGSGSRSVAGVIVGKALLEGRFSLAEAREICG